MAKWLDELFSLNKEASQTDAQQEFQKKVKNSAWVSGAMEIDENTMAKEADAKMEIEIAIRKEAAYEAFQTTEEVLNQDYARDASILSDFTLASMIAEMRGHTKQDFMENATEYFNTAKKDVKADRKACEKELIEGSGMSAQLDWRKSFADYKKDETPKQATEKELYAPKLEKVDESWADGKAKQADFETTDKARMDGMAGVGREEKERTDVTEQAGEIMKDAALVRDPEVELKVGSIVRLARSIMSHEGQILVEGTSWEITNIDGYHYTLHANGEKHIISSHDTPKFNKLASAHVGWDVFLNGKKIDKVFYSPSSTAEEIKKDLVDHDGYDAGITVKKEASQEITNQATKEQIITKLAEISSPWAVRVDKEGKEVIALVETPANTKESVDEKDNLNK